MKKRELLNLGFPHGPLVSAALVACGHAARDGRTGAEIRATIESLLANPELLRGDPHFGEIAAALTQPDSAAGNYALRADPHYAVWGDDIDDHAHAQMRDACRLPIAVAGALMPDAHVGYGLPIGGVLATENAVIPYAVGVDIACRVKMTVFDLGPEKLESDRARLSAILERETLFGVGRGWDRDAPQHDVLDEDWNVTPLTRHVRDLARRQLGTSGSGNHFVEFGEVEFGEARCGLAAGRYVGVVSHSGSRGSGAQICAHYSKLARELHPNLPKELTYLAWLPMDGVGAEYWAAMELMGKYAHANHDVIHRKIARALGAPVLYQVENHHNFAWKEQHQGRELIVHRKGATPAGAGVVGYIPGTMVAPGYLVEGLGVPESLHSASHGAGRCMSRTAARAQTRPSHMMSYLRERGVHLLSAGLDEAPQAYKDIERVMQAQRALVRPLARFTPRIVKMAPDGEKAED